jgi:hypothetical protein
MAAVLSRLAAIPVLLAVGAIVGGCGGGGSSTTHTSARSATAARSTPAPGAQAKRTGSRAARGRTKAQAQAVAFADMVNLQPADVPGFEIAREHKPHRESAGERRLNRELHACVGATGETSRLVEVSSREFERKGGLVSQSVSSQVTVDESPTLARKELGKLSGGHLRSCLSSYFSQLLGHLTPHGTRVSGVNTQYGSPPAPGTSGSFGLRITAKLDFQSVEIPFYLDYLGFVHGAAAVSLRSIGTPVPFPASVEEHLFSLLVERAKTHTS